MALRFLDSFDHYNTAQLGRKWTSGGGGAILAGGGRHSSDCLRLTNMQQCPQLDLDNQPTLIVGFAYKPTGFMSAGWAILQFVDAAGPSAQCSVSLDADGTINLRQGYVSTQLASSSPRKLLPNIWQYIEVKATIHNLTGLIEVRVGGVVWATYTGNTRATSNNYANRIRLNDGFNATLTTDWDDLYICDGQGSVNNDYLGEGRVDSVLPSGVGTYSEWTPSAGLNYQNVDENPANDDADYNSSATAGQRDSYGMADIGAVSGVVKGVAVRMTVGKDDLGSRNVQSLVRSGSTDAVGASQGLIEGYRMYNQIVEQDPATSAPWTVAGVNAAEFGIKLVS